MDSLWPDFQCEKIIKNDSIEILRQQARIIGNNTNGKVKASFSKMAYKSGAFTAAGKLGMALSLVVSEGYEELDEELKDKQDVSVWFTDKDYKFEIYNENYRFRLFILKYREVFPISLKVDEGILKEISYQNEQSINSNEELTDIVREIFTSKKVRTVVAKMMEQ